MKKLLIMTGVAAFAFGAFATIALPNGTGFDDENTTFPPDAYWGIPQAEWQGVVTSWSGEATPSCSRPEFFSGKQQANYFSLESAPASDALVRYIGTEPNKDYQPIGNGLYLDTLVQFTAVSADSTETMGTSEAAAKLAIWAQTSETTPTETNFVIQAGYVTSNNVISTNYVMTAPTNNFDYTAWHRLTVKAISDIGGDHAGFVVFVDGTALERKDGAVIADKGALTLNTVAGKFENAVLPSRRSSKWDDYQTLQAVSFSGTGGIDDVSFTDVAPDFAASDVIFTLNVGAGITGFTLNGTSYSDSDFTDGYVTLKLKPSDPTVTVANVTYDNNYKNAALSDASDGTVAGLVFTVTGDAPVATISAVCDMFTITVGADTFGYATLAAAIADASKGTIVMADNYTIEGAYVSVTGNVVLDLAGNTLTGPENDALFTVRSGASLTIINSAVADGRLSVNYEEGTGTSDKIVVYNNGTLVIGDTSGGFVTVDGFIANAVTKVYKGKFDVESNSNGDVCAIPSTSMDDRVVPVKEGDYWVVNAGGEAPVTTCTVTFSYTVPGAESATVSSVNVNAGTLLSELEWPTPPSVSGYTAAWPTYAEGASVTANVTFEAVYSANTYTVTFYTNTVEYATATYTYGNAASYTAPADPVVDGFTFGGWFTDDGTFEEEFVFSANVADNTQAYAKLTAAQPPEDEYPSYIPTGDAAAKAKYDLWAEYAGVATAATAEELEEAYLLNCKPEEVETAKAAFKFTSIYKDGDKWVTPTTTSYKDRKYNGTVTVKSYSDVECKTESETGTFFRATLQ